MVMETSPVYEHPSPNNLKKIVIKVTLPLRGHIADKLSVHEAINYVMKLKLKIIYRRLSVSRTEWS